MNKKSPHTDITNPQTSLEEVDDKMETLVVEQLDDLDPTDEELDEILDNLDDDPSWEWDDDQLELDLDEDRKPLTLGQRMKRRILMKRLAPKIARQRKIKMRRKAGKEDLQKRARKAAITILKKKVAGAKGADYKNLSPSEKIGIDKLVQKRLGAVDKIAKRLMPKILKKETERVQSMRSSKVNEEFETLIEKKVSQDPDVDERPGTQPKKYFAGVRKKSKEARAKHFERGTKMSDDDPAAYKPAPGDAGAKTKPSKHTKKFKQMYGESTQLDEDATKALKNKAEKSGMPLGILRKVYDRGVAAWRTGHRPGTNPQQWGLARVNSFVTKSSGTWGKADADLAKKVRGEEAVNPAQQAAIAISKKKSGKYDEDGKRLDEAFELFSEKVDLQAGINDPGIFKSVFLAGGPGSGKSFIVGKTALTALGLVLINSDDAFERQLAKIGLDTTPEDIFSPAGQAVRGKAKALTKLKQKLAIRGRLGLVIDGTGKNFDKIKKQSEELKRIGYETAMIFVNTDLDTALARNKARKRTLPDEDVTQMWKAVQNNIGKFQRYYGDKFIVVDNSDNADYEANVMSAYRKMAAFVKTDPKLPVAKKWIAQQKKQRGLKK